MRRSELEILADLVRQNDVEKVLEIGMAQASSTLAMLQALVEKGGGGHVTSIDPFQFADPPGMSLGIRGQGVENVRAAGLSHMHTCIAEPDYVALPALVKEGAQFDFVLIDGYHSFESTLLDFVYADRLLRVGGTCAFHDTAFPAVYKAVHYVMTNRSYRVLGPRPEPMFTSLFPKVMRRARYLLSGQSASFRERRSRWCSLAAFTKLADLQPPELTIADF